jgi:hypothetical protein
MAKSCWKPWSSCVVLLLAARFVVAEDLHEAWRADFDGGSLDGADKPVFVNGVSKEPEPDRLIFRSQQGVVVLGGQFDNSTDYAELAWPKLGQLSLKKNPTLEMRVRLPASDPKFWMEVKITYVTAGGSEHTITRYVSRQADWKTAAWRLAADEHLPEEFRPQALVGLSIRAHSDRPAEAEIDWVRLRGLNAAEQRREQEWLSLVTDGPPAEPAVLRAFFPFGVYDSSQDIGIHHLTHRHAFEVLARHHLNYKQAGFIRPGALEAGEQTAMRMSVSMRRMLESFADGGTDAAIAFAKPSIDAIGDNPVVVGYDIGDERPITDSWSAAAAAQILEQLDPGRFSSLCFFTKPHIAAYEPYLCLYLTDIYPLGFGKSPEYVYEWSYNLARQTRNRRHWIILQTFGDSRSRRWRPGAILPSVAELRMMTYGAIAGGARGIIYYTFNADLMEAMADLWANPLNHLLGEVSRLGELLIPIGRRLLDAEVDFETRVKNDNEAHVIVGVLHAPKRDVNYLVVVNKDVEKPQTANLTLPDAWRGRKILDLKELGELSGGLRVSLQPGDGRIYMIGSAEKCQAEVDAIRANRIEESLRVMTPDISTARGWGLDLSQVLHLRLDAEKFAQQRRRLDVGEQNVRDAGRLLESLLAGSEPYARIRAQLDRIGRRMGKVQPAMFEDLRDTAMITLMTPFREPYWQLHDRWAEAYGMLLEGQRDGLSSRVEVLDGDCAELLADVRQVRAGRPMVPPPGPGAGPAEKESAFGATPPAEARYVDGTDYWDLLPKLRVVEKLPLDGWQFKADHDKVGMDQGYFKPDRPAGDFTRTRIGRFWDHRGYQVLDEGWYRLRYKCPELPQGKRVFLHFGAVDESAWLYVDGQLVAWYDTAHPELTWNEPFLLELTGSLESGAEHLLAIRVGNKGGAGGIHKPVTLMVEK